MKGLLSSSATAMALVPSQAENHEKTKQKQDELVKLSINDLDAEEVGKVVTQLQEEIKIIKLQL